MQSFTQQLLTILILNLFLREIKTTFLYINKTKSKCQKINNGCPKFVYILVLETNISTKKMIKKICQNFKCQKEKKNNYVDSFF